MANRKTAARPATGITVSEENIPIGDEDFEVLADKADAQALTAKLRRSGRLVDWLKADPYLSVLLNEGFTVTRGNVKLQVKGELGVTLLVTRLPVETV